VLARLVRQVRKVICVRSSEEWTGRSCSGDDGLRIHRSQVPAHPLYGRDLVDRV